MAPSGPEKNEIHETAFCFILAEEFSETDPNFLIKGVAMETDPVCQMPVDPDMAEFKSEYREKEYYFCSSGCYDKFKRDPKDYV